MCPTSCPAGFVYSECVNLCPATCSQPSASDEDQFCKTDCYSGCVCPEGTLEHEGKCIKPNECPCSHQNRLYSPGESVAVRCNTCMCSEGSWKCTTDTCGGECTIFGSTAISTFDQLFFTMDPICSGYHYLQTEHLEISGLYSRESKERSFSDLVYRFNDQLRIWESTNVNIWRID